MHRSAPLRQKAYSDLYTSNTWITSKHFFCALSHGPSHLSTPADSPPGPAITHPVLLRALSQTRSRLAPGAARRVFSVPCHLRGPAHSRLHLSRALPTGSGALWWPLLGEGLVARWPHLRRGTRWGEARAAATVKGLSTMKHNGAVYLLARSGVSLGHQHCLSTTKQSKRRLDVELSDTV